MEYGLQMYSMRDIAERSLEEAVGKAAELGYKLIEFAGFMGKGSVEVNQMLKKSSVRIFGAHALLDELRENTAQTIAFHKAIGNRYFIIPWHDLSTGEKVNTFVGEVNRLAPLLKAEGIILCYHNHDMEFKENEDGLVPFDEIVRRTSLGLELDTYWAYVSGKDPLKMMEDLKERLCAIHLKDGKDNGQEVPLGLGDAPVKAVHEKAVAMGIPVIIESETLNPDGFTEARICMEYLKRLGAND